jgi:flagellar basal-body rod protein FlgC
MLDFMKSLSTAASGMKVQGERLRLVSENIANTDTPGYRRKLAVFRNFEDAVSDTQMVRVDKIILDGDALRRAYEPTNPLADETGHVTYSNVDLITEMADAREAQRSFEANLNIFDQTRRMYNNVLQLLRR